MFKLELRVPPVIVVLATGFLMWLGSRATPVLLLGLPGRLPWAGLLALVGLGMCAMGVISFRRAGTTVNPTTPGAASSLVRSGVYRLTRNPMYLGFALLLAGCAVWLANGLALGLVPAFVLYMNRYQIEPEERALTLRFGDEFRAYASHVRRWL
jgi:protein-S-isoprenylcysteine O-methyltransferase Ste14